MRDQTFVTLDGKTWRMEYQPTGTGFRYMDTANEWTGSDDLATLREWGGTGRQLAVVHLPGGSDLATELLRRELAEAYIR